jgi:hypothetical protein
MYLNTRHGKHVFDVHRSLDSSWFEKESIKSSIGDVYELAGEIDFDFVM